MFERTINHKLQRKIVGIIALLISPLVWWLAGEPISSVSYSYWTHAQDLFVGALFVVGFYLVSYRGPSEEIDLEYVCAKSAGVSAIVVALIPTAGDIPGDAPPEWVTNILNLFGVSRFWIVHYAAAILHFLFLVILLFLFARRAQHEKNKTNRAYFYRFSAGMMVIGIAVGIVKFFTGMPDLWDMTFWIEVWMLSWFGFGWFAAGAYKDDPEQSDAENDGQEASGTS